jgi:endonuclease III
LIINSFIKENASSISNKKWFTWVLVLVLLISNILSYQAADRFFEKNSNDITEEVKVEQDMLTSGNRIIDWAKELLRFFRNPQ